MRDPIEAAYSMVDKHQTGVWTAIPAIIQSFDATKKTVVAQPSVQGIQIAKDGSTTPINMPLLLDVPVYFPSGGGVTLTFPVKAGDECLVVFASRSIDAWHQSGGVQPQVEARMHDLSDGIAFVGISATPNVQSDISTSTAQLRSDDGSTFVQLDAEAQTLVLTAPGGATIDANTTINGTLHVTGQITCDADVVANGISLDHHTHTGVTAGSSSTGGPQ